jgi:hypothetical protein
MRGLDIDASLTFQQNERLGTGLLFGSVDVLEFFAILSANR